MSSDASEIFPLCNLETETDGDNYLHQSQDRTFPYGTSTMEMDSNAFNTKRSSKMETPNMMPKHVRTQWLLI